MGPPPAALAPVAVAAVVLMAAPVMQVEAATAVLVGAAVVAGVAADAVAVEIDGMNSSPPLGLGIGWRGALAAGIERRPDLGFVEIVAEDFFFGGALPQ